MKVKVESFLTCIDEEGEVVHLEKGVNDVSDYVGKDLVQSGLAKPVKE